MRNNCPDSALEDESEMERLRTHPLLANLRSLIGEERIRNITGRPRKPPEKEPDKGNAGEERERPRQPKSDDETPKRLCRGMLKQQTNSKT